MQILTLGTLSDVLAFIGTIIPQHTLFILNEKLTIYYNTLCPQIVAVGENQVHPR
jgi:hypothetical protein